MDDYRNKCQLCQTQFDCRNALHNHQIIEHFDDAVPCAKCDKNFINLMVLGEHMIAHANNIHSCSICGYLCKERFDLYIHVTSTHKSRFHLRCDLCAEVFASRRSLSEHFVRRHPEEFKSIAGQMEMFCNMHCPRKLPEVAKWPESGLAFAVPKSVAESLRKSTPEQRPLQGGAQKMRVDDSPKGSSRAMPQELPQIPNLQPQQIIANANQSSRTSMVHRSSGISKLGRNWKSTPTVLKFSEQLFEKTFPYDEELPFICVACGMKFRKPDDFFITHYMPRELVTPL